MLSPDVLASLWMLVSALFYSLQNAGVVLSGDNVGFWTICACRGAVGAVLMLFFLFRGGWHSSAWRLLLLRSVLGGVTILSLFFAVLRCGIAVPAVLTSTSPLWAALLAPKAHRWAFRDVVLGGCCVVGVFLMMFDRMRRHYDGSFYMGVASALVSAISQAGVNLTVRGLRDEPPALVAFWGMMGSVVLALPGAVLEAGRHRSNVSVSGVVPLVATGVLSALAQYSKTHALQVASSVSVLVVRHMEVVFSLLFGVFVFHEVLRWNTIAGACVVVAACIARLVEKEPTLPVVVVATPVLSSRSLK